MKKTLYKLLIVFAVVLLAACKKEKVMVTLNARMENVTDVDPNAQSGAKTYITNDERWVCWESTDKVTVCPLKDRTPGCDLEFDVAGGVGTTQALLAKEMDESDRDAHSNIFSNPIYLFSPNNLYPTRIDQGSDATSPLDDNWTITLPHNQPYRNDDDARADHSFSSQVLPMVAFSNGVDEPYQYFHPVCGILRLQFYSTSNDDVVIDQILVEAKNPSDNSNRKISGTFKVTGVNALSTPAIQDPEPFILPYGDIGVGDNELAITGIKKGVGGIFNKDKLYTFYLPLPYTKDPTYTSSDPEDFLDPYKLRITVKGFLNGSTSSPVQCSKILVAKIHRCNITKMRALDLTDFVAAPGAGTSTVQLVGDGSKDRPFQIYTAADLEKVRVAFATAAKGTPVINGQNVVGYTPGGSKYTYFKICRSDINLVTSDQYDALTAAQKEKAVVWTEGIRDFMGYMYFESSTANQGQIVNTSGQPLFENITSQGKVEGIFIGGTLTVAALDHFSPFCTRNDGYMINCRNACNVTFDVAHSGSSLMRLAGLCVDNYGTIQGGSNSGDLRSDNSDVAGICYNNFNIIEGSFTMSHATQYGQNISGVCFNNANSGIVRECIVTSSTNPVTSSGNVGIVVFTNRGLISDCRAAGSLNYTALGSLGGICNTNHGIVRNCSNTVTLVGCNTSVGGIVAINEAGEVYNCSNEGDHEIRGTNGTLTAQYAGGIVGWLKGGTITNCYSYCRVTNAVKSGGIVGRIEMAALAPISGNPVRNCWQAYSNLFYGENADTICKIGYSCFSPNGSENTALVGCNHFDDSYFTISVNGMLASYQAFLADPDGDGNASNNDYSGSTPAAGSHLVDALNFWVYYGNKSESRTSDTRYWEWEVATGEVLPRFRLPTTTKNFRSLLRSQSLHHQGTHPQAHRR